MNLSFYTREVVEQRENDTLASYAQKSKDSLGRVHRESPHSFRTEFQRDSARIIHSKAFRRLEYKTQVFLNGTGDHLRTRLTHTMEVASISRSIARALGVNEDLAEAIAFAHDLGHPPCGHTGEKALDRKMAAHGGFDHNIQSCRIVELLEKKYPDFHGLNLTYELREGLRKHQREFPTPPEWRSELGEVYASPSLEAQIANIADEIAYYSHDLDDGLDFSLVSPDQLSEVALWRETLSEVRSRYPHSPEASLYGYCIRAIIDGEVEDVVRTTVRNIESYEIRNTSDVRRMQKVVGYSDSMCRKNSELRRFLFQNLYHHATVKRINDRVSAMVDFVFDVYLRKPTLLSERLLSRVPEEGLHRVVCDYIAGMTDRFLMDEYARLQ